MRLQHEGIMCLCGLGLMLAIAGAQANNYHIAVILPRSGALAQNYATMVTIAALAGEVWKDNRSCFSNVTGLIPDCPYRRNVSLNYNATMVLTDSSSSILNATRTTYEQLNSLSEPWLSLSTKPIALLSHPLSSFSVPLALLSTVFNVPMISPTASAPRLSDSSIFGSFARMIAPDLRQSAALLKLIQYLYPPHRPLVHGVVVIHSAETYGSGLAESFGSIATGKIDIAQTISFEAFIGSGCKTCIGPADIAEKLRTSVLFKRRADGEPIANVVLLFCLSNDAAHVLIEARKLGLAGPSDSGLQRNPAKFLWLGVDGWLSEETYGLKPQIGIQFANQTALVKQAMAGVVGTRPFTVINSATESPNQIGQWFLARYAAARDSIINKFGIPSNLVTSSGAGEGAAYAFDAYWVIVKAIERCLQLGLNPEDGKVLFQQITSVSFNGITGEVALNSNGDRKARYDVVNIRRGTLPVFRSAGIAAGVVGNTEDIALAIHTNSTNQFEFASGLSEPPVIVDPDDSDGTPALTYYGIGLVALLLCCCLFVVKRYKKRIANLEKENMNLRIKTLKASQSEGLEGDTRDLFESPFERLVKLVSSLEVHLREQYCGVFCIKGTDRSRQLASDLCHTLEELDMSAIHAPAMLLSRLQALPAGNGKNSVFSRWLNDEFFDHSFSRRSVVSQIVASPKINRSVSSANDVEKKSEAEESIELVPRRKPMHSRTRSETESRFQQITYSTLVRDPSTVFLDPVLLNCIYWDFDVFYFASLAEGAPHSIARRPMKAIGFALIQNFRLIETLNLNPQHMLNLLDAIEDGYNDLPFHCSLHGADVAQSISAFLIETELYKSLEAWEILMVLLAALCHDFGHPGKNNSFLSRTNDPLAIRYNDISVLESMHAAESMKVILRPEYHLFDTLIGEEGYLGDLRKLFVSLILATDLKHHFELVNEFKYKSENGKLGEPLPMKLDGVMTEGNHVRRSSSSISKHSIDISSDFGINKTRLIDRDSLLLALKMCIKCADLGHPAKAWELHEEWSERIAQEMLAQGDEEKKQRLSVSPFMDRDDFNLAASQSGFFRFLIEPMWEPFAEFFKPLHSCYAHVIENRDKWVELAPKTPKVVPVASPALSDVPEENSRAQPQPEPLNLSSSQPDVDASAV